MKTIKLTSAHTSHNPQEKMELNLQGGCPYFTYIWIDDVCYVLTKKNVAKIKKVR